MIYLVDTNVLSELRKRRRDERVVAWWDTVHADDVATSALVVGEIRLGIERLRARDRAQASALEHWLTALRASFAERILPVTAVVAEAWARLSVPHPLPTVDGLIAATALVNGLTLVTRDTAPLERTGISLLSPWE